MIIKGKINEKNKYYTFKTNVFDDEGNIIFLKNEIIETDMIVLMTTPISGPNNAILSIVVKSKVNNETYTFYNKNLFVSFEYTYTIDECFYTVEEVRDMKLKKLL